MALVRMLVSPVRLTSLLVCLSGILAQHAGPRSFNLLVMDNQLDGNKVLYQLHSPPGGVLLGALTRLAKSPHSKFTFSFSENPDYGSYLESVNGLFGNEKDHTHWELLVQLANKTIISPGVGISCYIPQASELGILNYSKW